MTILKFFSVFIGINERYYQELPGIIY